MRRLFVAVALFATQAVVAGEQMADFNNHWYMENNYHWVTIKPKPPTTPVANLPEAVAGRLMMPSAVTGSAPAVLVLHGSAGVDSRGVRYAEQLRKAGFVTLELDIWQAMGIAPGAGTRPRTVMETMPSVWGALNFLASHTGVDPKRIGVMGFSWGGIQTLLAAREPIADATQPHFSSFAAQYPICWVYNRVPGYQLTSVSGPLQIGIGDHDDYDDGAAPCQNLASGLVRAGGKVDVNVYRDSYHGFDRLESAVTVMDPYAHLGAGGQVTIQPNHYAGYESVRDVVKFFRRTLKTPQN